MKLPAIVQALDWNIHVHCGSDVLVLKAAQQQEESLDRIPGSLTGHKVRIQIYPNRGLQFKKVDSCQKRSTSS